MVFSVSKTLVKIKVLFQEGSLILFNSMDIILKAYEDVSNVPNTNEKSQAIAKSGRQHILHF